MRFFDYLGTLKRVRFSECQTLKRLRLKRNKEEIVARIKAVYATQAHIRGGNKHNKDGRFPGTFYDIKGSDRSHF